MLNKKALSATAGAGEPIYIEDVFSTYLYTGNGSTQTITNNIDLSGEGGLVWVKDRTAANSNGLWDTARGAGTGTASSANNALSSNLTAAQGLASSCGYVSNFGSTGFSVVNGGSTGGSTALTNLQTSNYASWTFRKAKKFFDVVTYTGNGSNRTIAHNLGSVPGCIIVKRTDSAADWQVYHGSLANTEYLVLNTTAAKATGATRWNSTTPTSTVFSLGTDATVNANGGTYVAYLFAHNAGGFGESGSDSVISCGSFTTDGSKLFPEVNLGWEPQWLLIKNMSASGSWRLQDSMRGMTVSTASEPTLVANATSAEDTTTYDFVTPTATGFANPTGSNPYAANNTYIYVAIRRGPMKTPEAGTNVYTSELSAGTTASPAFTSNFVVDLAIKKVPSSSNDATLGSRLQGARVMYTTASSAEEASTAYKYDFNNGFGYGYSTSTRAWLFRRAPKFMDVVCFTGDGTTNKSISHNLGATPNLIIAKSRSTSDWLVYTSSPSYELVLNTSDAEKGQVYDFYPSVNSSTVFGVAPSAYSGAANINVSGITYVAYLFATLAGVSKVGSYTGSGTTKQINCGFTAGARFVMIKRTDSTGDWYVWDSSRGIVTGNDPYMLLNLPDPDVTNTDYIDTYSQGFEISSTAPAAINANGGTYIFLAIA